MAGSAARLCGLALVLFLAGCGGRPTGVFIPIASDTPGATSIDILVATTRARDDRPGELFSGERGREVAFANIVVSIPPDANRKVGEIQWAPQLPPDPSKSFATLKVEQLDRDGAIHQLNTMVAKHKPRRVMVFVHGYNNRFDDAVYRFAQIVHDSQAPVAPVLFTWPSRASLLAYGYDRESSTYSRDALEGMLGFLADDPNVDEVSVLAHSMGNWVTMEALRQMAIRRGSIPRKISAVMMAAPDVDVDVFRTQIRAIPEPRPQFTLFVSTDDKALAMSKRVWGSTARLGAIDPSAEPYKTALAEANLAVVDMSKIQTEDKLGHGKFAESAEVVRLIGTRLAEGQTINDMKVGFGDHIANIATSTGTAVGATAGLVLAAPVAVVDSATRENYSARVYDIVPAGGGVPRKKKPGEEDRPPPDK